jgi:hypothetical protein
MGEQHFDLLSLAAADGELFGMRKVAGDLPGIFVHVPHDRSGGRSGASFSDRAGFAVSGVCTVMLDPSHRVSRAKRHFVPFETGESVTVRVIGEMAQIILAARLMLAVKHRDVGCDIALEQPSEERAGAIGFVCGQCIRAEGVPLGSARQHLLGGDDLLAQPGRGRLDVHDDTVVGVDQIVGLIAEPSRSILDGSRRLWIGF